MNMTTFKVLATKWALETIVPAIAPEGPARWLMGFGASAKLGSMIDEYSDFIPRTPDGHVDCHALKKSLCDAFTAQPKLAITLPSMPALVAFGMGEITLTLDKEDVDSFLKYLDGNTTTTEVKL